MTGISGIDAFIIYDDVGDEVSFNSKNYLTFALMSMLRHKSTAPPLAIDAVDKNYYKYLSFALNSKLKEVRIGSGLGLGDSSSNIPKISSEVTNEEINKAREKCSKISEIMRDNSESEINKLRLKLQDEMGWLVERLERINPLSLVNGRGIDLKKIIVYNLNPRYRGAVKDILGEILPNIKKIYAYINFLDVGGALNGEDRKLSSLTRSVDTSNGSILFNVLRKFEEIPTVNDPKERIERIVHLFQQAIEENKDSIDNIGLLYKQLEKVDTVNTKEILLTSGTNNNNYGSDYDLVINVTDTFSNSKETEKLNNNEKSDIYLFTICLTRVLALLEFEQSQLPKALDQAVSKYSETKDIGDIFQVLKEEYEAGRLLSGLGESGDRIDMPYPNQEVTFISPGGRTRRGKRKLEDKKVEWNIFNSIPKNIVSFSKNLRNSKN